MSSQNGCARLEPKPSGGRLADDCPRLAHCLVGAVENLESVDLGHVADRLRGVIELLADGGQRGRDAGGHAQAHGHRNRLHWAAEFGGERHIDE